MLAAIIPRESQAWFFRLLGPAEAVEAQTADFRALVKSVHFAPGGTPEWTLPKGWEQKPASGMRHATIEIASSGGPLDLSVTVLPRNEPDQDTYTLSNLNRWARAAWIGAARRATTQRERRVNRARGCDGDVCRLAGQEAARQHVSRALRRRRNATWCAGRSATNRSDSRQGRAGTDAWCIIARVDVRRAADVDRVGGQRPAQGLVFDRPERRSHDHQPRATAGGVLLPNVNRWRQQIGLGEIQQEELDREAKKIEVSGLSGDLVELIGVEKATLGVVLQRGEQTWFFKLVGPPDLVTRERQNFGILCAIGAIRRHSDREVVLSHGFRHRGCVNDSPGRAKRLPPYETMQQASETYGK